MLVLRSCKADLTSYNGFQWPESGHVAAPDWAPTKDCGNGLHGFAWGEGKGKLAYWERYYPGAKWLVVEVDEKNVIDLDGKVKFPEGTVVYCGDRKSAVDYILAHGAAGKAVVGADLIVGDHQGVIVGYNGTATAGDRGTATAGDRGTATAGDRGTATAGYNGTATAGDRGTATAGYNGTATAGDRGTATAGYNGTATAGDRGTATAGYNGTATAGYNGTLQIKYYDFDACRYRRAIAYVGEGGIKADTPYKLDDKHQFVEVQ